jgi:mono/diheme cytochrome c family protein
MVDAMYGLLKSVGFTDPLHALLVHMPMGLVIGAFLMVLVALLFRRKNLLITARHVSILAFLFVFPTILFGVFDWLHFFKGAMIQPIRFKMALAAAVLLILGAGIVAGGGLKVRNTAVAVLSALAFACVVGLGYFGGGLVYGGWAGGGPATGQAAAALSPTAKAGEAVFLDNCASCHAGGGNVVVEGLPLKKSGKLRTREALAAFLRAPKMPDGSQGGMPPFPVDALSDAQAGDLFDYLTAMVPVWR